MEKIYFANDLDCQYEILKQNLFVNGSFSLRRTIIVPSPHSKEWLMEKFAKDKEIEGIMFLKLIDLKHLPSFLLDFFEPSRKFPNYLELNLMIETKLKHLVKIKQKESSLKKTPYEKPDADSERLLRYLQMSDQGMSLKSKRRLSSIVDFLTPLFYMYFVFQNELDHNEKTESSTWQMHLLNEVFREFVNPQKEIVKQLDIWSPFARQIHLFNISYLPFIYRHALTKLPFDIFHYSLSPCKYFWEDISTEKEKYSFLKRIKKNKDKEPFELFKNLFAEANFLLANLGKIKREYLKILDDRDIESFECYVNNEDRWLEEKEWKNFSLLAAVKQDILHLRNIEKTDPISIKKEKDSFQIHEAPSKMREVEILYDYILRLLSTNKDLKADDIKIYAPDIKEYLPYINFVFGDTFSPIDYRAFDLDNIQNSFFAQGVISFLYLFKSRWEKKDILDLFENPAFMKKQEFSKTEILKLKSWIEKANISWGIDESHRQNILREKLSGLHFKSWEHGLERIMSSFVFGDCPSDNFSFIPINEINFSDVDIFEKFLSIFIEIQKDIEYMEEERNLKDWSLYLSKILDKYFSVDESSSSETLSLQMIIKFIEKLFSFSETLSHELFDFSSIFRNLKRALKKDNSSFHGHYTLGVSFYSLKEEILPSAVTCVIGMNEEFPRKDPLAFHSLLYDHSKSYIPTLIDKDRNLFLDILLLSRETIFLSYVGISSIDGRRKLPSSLIREFCLYIDQAFYIGDEKPSDFIFFKHPALSFDKKYFQKQIEKFYSFSNFRFKAAKKYYHENDNSFFFIHSLEKMPDFFSKETEIPDVIDLKKLSSLATNPIKFYLNEVLHIYLEKRKEDLDSKDLILSFLDQYIMRKNGISKNIDVLIDRMEKEGNFPVGICKEVAKDKIKAQTASFYKNMRKMNVKPTDLASAQLSLSNIEIQKKSVNEILIPPAEIFLDDKKICITGQLDNISPEGFLAFSDDKTENILRVWPEFLIFLKVKNSIYANASPSLLFIQSGKVISFDNLNVDRALTLYLRYFKVCLTYMSPLIRDWSLSILTKDEKELDKSIRKSLFDRKLFEDLYFNWAFSRFENKLSSEDIYNNWSVFLKNTFKDLLDNVYGVSIKGEKQNESIRCVE